MSKFRKALLWALVGNIALGAISFVPFLVLRGFIGFAITAELITALVFLFIKDLRQIGAGMLTALGILLLLAGVTCFVLLSQLANF